MGSRSNSDYVQVQDPDTQNLMELLGERRRGILRTSYKANLTAEQFSEVQTNLRGMDGNPQVEHPTTANIYVVTMDRQFANTRKILEILRVFQSHDGNATQVGDL